MLLTKQRLEVAVARSTDDWHQFNFAAVKHAVVDGAPCTFIAFLANGTLDLDNRPGATIVHIAGSATVRDGAWTEALNNPRDFTQVDGACRVVGTQGTMLLVDGTVLNSTAPLNLMQQVTLLRILEAIS